MMVPHMFRSVRVGMALLAFVACCACLGQDTADRRDALEEKLRVLDREHRTLSEGVGAPETYKEWRKLQRELRELRREQKEELRKPQERLAELWKDQAVKDWREQIQKKEAERKEIRVELQREVYKRAAEIYNRRHTELSGIAVVETPAARVAGFSPLTYPRVNGSTSAHPLGVIIACKMLGCQYRWRPTAHYMGGWSHRKEEPDWVPTSPWPLYSGLPRVDRSSLPQGGFQMGFGLHGYRPAAVPAAPGDVAGSRLAVIVSKMLTSHGGTHRAYESVIRGESDIGLVARMPSSDELKLGKERGVALDVEPFALDAFVFIKHYKNPVKSLTVEQIQSIYTGKIGQWDEVGGRDEKIRAYRRNRNSGSQELMEKLVMKDLEFASLDSFPRAVLSGMGGPYLALSRNEAGIAYSVYYYEHFMAGSPNTELLAVNGVLPSYETISKGTYPYVTKVYIATRKGPDPKSGTVKLKQWLLSSEGQAVVRESGYVPITR